MKVYYIVRTAFIILTGVMTAVALTVSNADAPLLWAAVVILGLTALTLNKDDF